MAVVVVCQFITRDTRILRQKIAKSACHFCKYFNPFFLWYNLWHRCTVQSIVGC